MPEYDFKCSVCGVLVMSSHPIADVPDEAKLHCPGPCGKQTSHFRVMSIPALGRGASGERFRPSV